MRITSHRVISLVSLLALSGCVTTAAHEKALADAANRMKVAQQSHAAALASAQSRIVSLQDEVTALQQQIKERDAKIAAGVEAVAELQQKLDGTTAVNQQLSDALQKAGKNVDKLLAEKGKIGKALVGAKKRLEELRKAQAASKKRAALYKKLILKFKKMTESGDLKIVLRDGRMVLQLRTDVLFDSGQQTIKKDGKRALEDVAGILITITNRKLQVAGHTDNVPISTQRFKSNWELSTARAVSVVKFLIEQGVKTELLSAAGYSQFQPVTSNDTTEGKSKNRRIEIVLQPNINELVSVPDVN